MNTFTVSGDKAATLEDMVKEFGASNFTVDVYDAAGTPTNGAVEVDVVSGTVTDGASNQLYVSQTTGHITSSETNTAATGAAGDQQSLTFASSFAGVDQGESKTIGHGKQRVATPSKEKKLKLLLLHLVPRLVLTPR